MTDALATLRADLAAKRDLAKTLAEHSDRTIRAGALVTISLVEQVLEALPEPLPEDERSMLHAILEHAHAEIDREDYPDLHARIDAVLTPCDEADDGRRHPTPPCTWTQNEDGYYDTTCQQAYAFDDAGTPLDHHFVACPFCARRLALARIPAVYCPVCLGRGTALEFGRPGTACECGEGVVQEDR